MWGKESTPRGPGVCFHGAVDNLCYLEDGLRHETYINIELVYQGVILLLLLQLIVEAPYIRALVLRM